MVNSGLRNSEYGSNSMWINVEEGANNRLEVTKLPMLNKNTAFDYFSPEDTEINLQNGMVKIGLSTASVGFPESLDKGKALLAYFGAGEIYKNSNPGLFPSWIYSVQPSGIVVNGSINLDFELPARNGGYHYLPENETLVVLVGLDVRSDRISVAGVGRIFENRIFSVFETHFQTLDIIGYVQLDENKNLYLEQYVNQEISFRELTRLVTD